MMTKDSEMWSRIKEAFMAVGITRQVEIAEVCGIGQAAVSKWKLGQSTPTIPNALAIQKKTGYSGWWIYTGLGDKLADGPDPIAKTLLSLFEGCSEAQKAEVLRYIALLSAGQSSK